MSVPSIPEIYSTDTETLLSLLHNIKFILDTRFGGVYDTQDQVIIRKDVANIQDATADLTDLTEKFNALLAALKTRGD